MGYSTNPAVLESRRASLAELEAGRACRWRTTPDPAVTRRKAQEIHEALYIASLYPDKYPELAAARKAFAIHIIAPGLIEAKPRPIDGGLTPVHGISATGTTQAPEPSTVAKTRASEIIDAWYAHAPSQDPLNFQQTTLPLEEMMELYRWTADHRPRMMILTGEGFLTLGLLEIGMEAYAWTPPKLTEPLPEPSYDI